MNKATTDERNDMDPLLYKYSAFTSLLRALVAHGKNLEDEDIKAHVEEAARLLDIPKDRVEGEVDLAMNDDTLLSLASVEKPKVFCDSGDILPKDFVIEDKDYCRIPLSSLYTHISKRGRPIKSYKAAIMDIQSPPSKIDPRRVMNTPILNSMKNVERELLGIKVYSDRERQKSHEMFLKRVFTAMKNSSKPKNVSYYKKLLAQTEEVMMDIYEIMNE